MGAIQTPELKHQQERDLPNMPTGLGSLVVESFRDLRDPQVSIIIPHLGKRLAHFIEKPRGN